MTVLIYFRNILSMLPQCCKIYYGFIWGHCYNAVSRFAIPDKDIKIAMLVLCQTNVNLFINLINIVSMLLQCFEKYYDCIWWHCYNITSRFAVRDKQHWNYNVITILWLQVFYGIVTTLFLGLFFKINTSKCNIGPMSDQC